MALGLSGNGLITGFDPTASGFGKVLQVVSVNKNDTFSTTSSTYVDITGLSLSITPTKNTSKVLIFCSFIAGASDASISFYQLVRGSTAIGLGTGGTNNTTTVAYNGGTSIPGAALPVSFHFLDSPATTSATTYKMTVRIDAGYTSYVGRRANDTIFVASSQITAIEVAA